MRLFLLSLHIVMKLRWKKGWGAVPTLGNIKTDSALCALIKKTIKKEHKPVFNALPLFLSPQTCFSSLLDGAAAAAAAEAPRPKRPAWTPVPE